MAEPRFIGGEAFREGWRWRRGIARWFLEQTQRLDLPRPLLHVCAGSSRLGDVTVDKYINASVKADALALPFADGAIGAAIFDGPYEWDLQTRLKASMELARVLRPGGRLLWKARYLPPEGKFKIESVTVATRRVGMLRDADLLVVAARRYPGKNAGVKNYRPPANRGSD